MFPIITSPDEFCIPCGLYKECKTPFMRGEGSDDPVWEFVGEAPGGEEDEQGIPFCGESGAELRQSIEDVGIDIAKCRFTNAVRCRPPKNDLKAYPDAIHHCRPHILRELRSTRPKVVVLIGNSAIKSVLNRQGILSLHGKVIDMGWTKAVCMFHPQYLIRNGNKPALRRKFLEALKTAKFLADPKIMQRKSERKHTVILDRKMLQEYVDFLKKQDYLAHDIETSTGSPFSVKRQPKISVGGFSWSKSEACAFPIYVREGLKGCKVRPEEMLEGMKEVLESGVKLIMWNGKFDSGYELGAHKIWTGGKGAPLFFYFDGMLASYAQDERHGIHGLKDWAARVGMAQYDLPLKQYQMMHPETDPEKGGNMNLVPASILYSYNMDDCICTFRCFLKQRKTLKMEKLWEKPFLFPLRQVSWVAQMMEINGMAADLKRNAELEKDFSERIVSLERRIRKYPEIRKLQGIHDEKRLMEVYQRVRNYKRPVPDVKEKVFSLFKSKPVNLDSPEIKRELIYDIMELEHYAKTKKSEQPSAARWVIDELLQEHKNPLLKDLIERSEYSSAKSKYIDPIPKWVGSDGRVHTNMLVHGTETGRLSSRNPNLYNLPARSKLTPILLSQFCARDKDYVIVKQDSKQIELRLIADRARDKVMIKEFMDGKDPHAMGAQAAYNLTEAEWIKLPKEEQKEKRSNCKNAVSFGLVYGREAEALAKDFGWSLNRARKFKAGYFGKYSGIAEYLDAQREIIGETGFVVSNFGRHRRLPDAFHEDIGRRNHAIRQGINSPIQGDASDINIIAAYRMERWLRKNKMKSRVFLYVYDAVYVDTFLPELDVVVHKLREFMTDRKFLFAMTGWNLRVPLETDCSIGRDAGNTVELLRNKDMSFILPKEIAA